VADQVKEMLNALGAFKTRMSESQERLHTIGNQVSHAREERLIDPRSKFLQALDATEARAAKLDREIAEVELMLKNWLSSRLP